MEMDRQRRKLTAPARIEACPRFCTRSRRVLSLACGVLMALLTTGTAVAAAAGTGGVAGLVQDAATEAPIAGIEVCARPTAEPLATPTCAMTKAMGEYEIAGLSEGEYHVWFTAPAETGLNYLTQYFEGRSTEALADPVTVAEATTTQNVNALLQPGGEIEGTVTEGEGIPIAGVEVCALERGIEVPSRCVLTTASGEYAIAGLAGGEYDVEFSASPGYVTQFYEAAASRAQAKAVKLTAGAPAVEGVSAVLQPVTGGIAGTVRSAVTKAPLAGVQVCAHGAARKAERCTASAADGAYTIAALPVGPYTVHFLPAEAGSSYAPQFYDNKANEAEADAVTVTADATVTGVDAVLQGIPVAVLRPAIAGRAAEGQTLRVIPGTWTNAPVLTDEWGQCDATGAIESCFTIAATPTYTPTAADVGCTLRVREQASNQFGIGTPVFLFSPPTALVTTASGGAGACRPAPSAARTWSPPAASSGVSSETARAASTAQLRALLTRVLVPHGKGARLAAVRAHGGYTARFQSLAAGRLSVSWDLMPKGAHGSAAKPRQEPLLIASGKLTTRASGTAKLRIELTSAGRALLARGKPVKLTAKGAFAPAGRPTLKAARNFRLSR